MNKRKLILILFCLLNLTACPAPKYDFVIINSSEKELLVEYIYVLPMVKYDNSEITYPAKIDLASYNKGEAIQWRKLNIDTDYTLEAGKEPYSVKMQDSSEEKTAERTIHTIKLKLQPNEVLRVFNSEGINMSMKGVKKIVLTGEKGKLEIEGEGFRQFDPYRPTGFFKQVRDYRIVYGSEKIYD